MVGSPLTSELSLGSPIASEDEDEDDEGMMGSPIVSDDESECTCLQ